MKVYTINTDNITDWDSFHIEFKKELNFPEHYGQNMDAWIDCVDDLSDQPVTINILNGKKFKLNHREFVEAILECAAFVNMCKIEREENPNLIISGHF